MQELDTPRSVLSWTALICVLVTVSSLVGLVDAGTYEQETQNWATQAKGQDVGNLLAVAALAISGYRSAKGSFRASLVWVGTLLYFLYAFVVYSLAVHFNGLFLVYVSVLGLTSYALVFSLDRLRGYDAEFPRSPVRRLAGYTLVAVGVLFAVLWLSEVVPATIERTVPQSVLDAGLWVNPIHVIDLAVVLPAFVITGSMTARGRRSGSFFAGPWLVFSALMGASIVAGMILMALERLGDILVPMVMVSVVVLASLYAAWRFLQRVEDPPRVTAAAAPGPRRTATRRATELDRQETSLAAREAALAQRMQAAQKILRAADRRDVAADARDVAAVELSLERDRTDFLDPNIKYGEHWPERREASEGRAGSKDDREASKEDRLALTEPEIEPDA